MILGPYCGSMIASHSRGWRSVVIPCQACGKRTVLVGKAASLVALAVLALFSLLDIMICVCTAIYLSTLVSSRLFQVNYFLVALILVGLCIAVSWAIVLGFRSWASESVVQPGEK